VPQTHFRTTLLRIPLSFIAGVLACIVFYLLFWAVAALTAHGAFPITYALESGVVSGVASLALGFVPWVVMHFRGARSWRNHLALGASVGLLFCFYAFMTGRTGGLDLAVMFLFCMILATAAWMTAWRVMYRLEPVAKP
jgi:hypothetical protein